MEMLSGVYVCVCGFLGSKLDGTDAVEERSPVLNWVLFIFLGLWFVLH